MTGRRLPTVCRIMGTCYRLRQKTSCRDIAALCAVTGGASLRLGHPRGCPLEDPSASLASLTNQIEAMGIAAFNDACRASVLPSSTSGRRMAGSASSLGRLRPSITGTLCDLALWKSVIWAFKRIVGQGAWPREGYRVLHCCWRDETPNRITGCG